MYFAHMKPGYRRGSAK